MGCQVVIPMILTTEKSKRKIPSVNVKLTNMIKR